MQYAKEEEFRDGEMHMEDKKIQFSDQKETVIADEHIKATKEFVSPQSLYDELIASVKRYHPSADISLIEKAYKIAEEAVPCASLLFLLNWNWIKKPLLQEFSMMWWKTL